MTKTISNAASLALVACSLTLAGCYGDLVSTRPDEQGDDAPGDGSAGDDSSGDDAPAVDAAPISSDADLVCAEPTAATESGRHRPGERCGACHDGQGGPAFTIGGTLFSDASGSAPVAGVTISLLDAEGTRIDMVSAENGNFWTDQPVVFPVTAYASSCPDLVPMQTLADSGDCNACHEAGEAIGFAP